MNTDYGGSHAKFHQQKQYVLSPRLDDPVEDVLGQPRHTKPWGETEQTSVTSIMVVSAEDM